MFNDVEDAVEKMLWAFAAFLILLTVLISPPTCSFNFP